MNPPKIPRPIEQASTTEGIPPSISMGPLLEVELEEAQEEGAEGPYGHPTALDGRSVLFCAIAMGIGCAAGGVAQALVALIGMITNLAFFGRFSAQFVSPAQNHLGIFVMGVPVLGGILVGLMARWGSPAIRGHGIPEAMEQILVNESRIPARITFLKPLSAAISIGTGGPFGAEGPIIATGGALGSVVGQLMRTTAVERKTLLAAGAAAGMTATFGCPVAAVLLAIELLLFEYRARSLVPVALAATAATAVRLSFVGFAPAFSMPELSQIHSNAIVFYIALGAVVGVAAVYITRLVYWIEDLFEHLPIHWMWWPALGGIAVGVLGYLSPRTLGVGYTNIDDILSQSLTGQAMIFFCVMKLISWAVSLGSGTSGGTLAPLFTVGGGLGAGLALLIQYVLPHQGVDPRVGALVGMAAMFAGASRALLASVVFAFETTHQAFGLLPLLGGCTASYLVSSLLMKNTIMTEKIERRGIRVPSEYSADHLEQVQVRSVCSHHPVILQAEWTVGELRERINQEPASYSHQGFPVIDAQGHLLGVLTRRDFLEGVVAETKTLQGLIHRPPVVIHPEQNLREAADLMTRQRLGRLPVVARSDSPAPNEKKNGHAQGKVVGMLTRSDLLSVDLRRLNESHRMKRSLHLNAARLVGVKSSKGSPAKVNPTL